MLPFRNGDLGRVESGRGGERVAHRVLAMARWVHSSRGVNRGKLPCHQRCQLGPRSNPLVRQTARCADPVGEGHWGNTRAGTHREKSWKGGLHSRTSFRTSGLNTMGMPHPLGDHTGFGAWSPRTPPGVANRAVRACALQTGEYMPCIRVHSRRRCGTIAWAWPVILCPSWCLCAARQCEGSVGITRQGRPSPLPLARALEAAMHFGAFFYGTVDMPDAGIDGR